MRLTLGLIALTLTLASAGMAQRWEIGGVGGYGWNVGSSTISNPLISAKAEFPNRGTVGAVFAENPYHHLGGEIRWLYQFGGPQLELNRNKTSMSGYSNLITYDFVIYPVARESGLRPYLAGGAGVKIFTGTGFRFIGQQATAAVALLNPCTQAEPAVSAGGGLKYIIARHTQLRLDFRAYFTPTPDRVFRPIVPYVIHGWIYDLVPMAGISYVF